MECIHSHYPTFKGTFSEYCVPRNCVDTFRLAHAGVRILTVLCAGSSAGHHNLIDTEGGWGRGFKKTLQNIFTLQKYKVGLLIFNNAVAVAVAVAVVFPG